MSAGNPEWRKGGKSPNPKGRPVDLNPPIVQLKRAIAAYEKNNKCNLMDHFIKTAMIDNAVLTALMKKILPDCKEITGDIAHRIEWVRSQITLAEPTNSKQIESTPIQQIVEIAEEDDSD